jgi:carboxyl-terminal processing protease
MSEAPRSIRAFVAMMATLACAACSVLDPYDVIGRQLGEAAPVSTEVVPSPPPATLGAAARERAFDFVWRTIDRRYHDPRFNGVDWKTVGERYRPLALAAPDDDAFWDVLDRMTGELRDSHTRVESPRRVALRKRDESITLGLSFIPIGDRLAVDGVHPDSDAWWAGVRPGMIIVSIGGKPAGEAYAKLLAGSRIGSTARARHLQAVRRLVTGAAGEKVAFTFERGDGTRFDAVLARRKVELKRTETHRVLPSGYGYLRFSQWTIPLTLRALGALDELKSTPGLVIDLRGNPGGAVSAVNMMLERFFAHPTVLGRTTTRTGQPVSLFLGAVDIIQLKREIEGDPGAYRGPVAILVDARSASGSELFAGTMQAAGRAKVVGEASCGCLLGFLGYAHVPGGADLAYSEVGFELSNGRKIEGEGVIPDVAVPATLDDLRLYRDRALEQAQALLATMKPSTL